MKLYPLKFEPILKSTIWGGKEICNFKRLPACEEPVGESWEISGVRGNISTVSNGELKGKNLEELVGAYKEALVGKKIYEAFGSNFPLLIKFIDARDDLSIQVHPDDKLAKERHDSFGKTEMWYVINAEPGAFLYSGFQKQMNPDTYVKSVENNTFTDSLMKHDVKAGDVFFLPAGRVHAIGAGTFIAEIQQTSDITYRIYDFDRKDANGNGRELHTELAKDAIDYNLYDSYKTDYASKKDESVNLESNVYFTTNLLELTKGISRDYSKIDSFVIYICMQGECTVQDNKGNELTLKQGETILIPADTQSTKINPSKDSLLLEVYV